MSKFTPPRSRGDIFAIGDAFHDSAALLFACARGLFDGLVEPTMAGEVAAAHAWSAWRTAVLLNYLTAMGLLGRDGERYSNEPIANAFLVRSRPSYIGAALEHQRLQWQLWDGMDTAPTGRNLTQNERFDDQQEANEAFNEAMALLAREKIDEVAALPWLQNRRFVLDLAGNHGCYLAALAHRNPEMRGEVWDFARVRQSAERKFAEASVSDRLTFREADISSPVSYAGVRADAALLNDCLHYFDRATLGDVFQSVHRALDPDGVVVVTMMTLAANGVEPHAAAGFSLHMMLNTDKGLLHPTPIIERALECAGFDLKHASAMNSSSGYTSDRRRQIGSELLETDRNLQIERVDHERHEELAAVCRPAAEPGRRTPRR